MTVGVNAIDILDDRGTSVDLSIDASQRVTLYGELAEYGDQNAHVYGIRLSDMNTRSDGRGTILVCYQRSIDIGFVPAAVGASVHFEDQDGWAGGVYHQLNPKRAVGIFTDGDEAILTLFGTVPL